MKRQNMLLKGCLIIGLIVSQMPVIRADLGGWIDGRTTPVYYDAHQTFTGWSRVLGRVQFMDGFTINPGVQVHMNISETVYGDRVTLSKTGVLILDGLLTVKVNYFDGGIVECAQSPFSTLKFVSSPAMTDPIIVSTALSLGSSVLVIDLSGNNMYFFDAYAPVAQGWMASQGIVVDPGVSACVIQNGLLTGMKDTIDAGNTFPKMRSKVGGAGNVQFADAALFLDGTMTFTTPQYCRLSYTVNLNSSDINAHTMTIGGSTYFNQASFAATLNVNKNITLAFDNISSTVNPNLLQFVFNNGDLQTNTNYSFARSSIEVSGVSHFQTSRPGRNFTMGAGVAGFDTNILINPGSKLVIGDGLTLAYDNIN